MANDFYNVTTDLDPFTRARSGVLDAEFAGIAAGFAKLPSETRLLSGNSNFATAGGTANAITVSAPTTWTSYTGKDGYRLSIKITTANTSTVTLNVDGLGAKAVVRLDGDALQADDLQVNGIYDFFYNNSTGKFHVAAWNSIVTDAETAATNAATSETNAANSASAASTSANNASASATTATNYATKTDGFASGSDNSAKSWAIGGTGDGDPTAGSAKDWATSTTEVAGGLKGAKGYAEDAEGYASGLNLPSASGNGGRYLRQEDAETGFAYVDLDRFATSPYCTDSGAADAYVLTTGFSDAAPIALNDGDQYRFRADNTNTGASTVNVGGLGAKTMVTVTGAALPAGYIRTDVDTTITYDAANDRFTTDRQIETGSNANGNFERLANGTQICWHGVNMGAGNFAGSGSLSDMYRTNVEDWTFPAEFSDNIYRLAITPRATATGADGFVTANGGATRSTTGVTGIQCFRGTNSGSSVTAEFIAKGKWY